MQWIQCDVLPHVHSNPECSRLCCKHTWRGVSSGAKRTSCFHCSCTAAFAAASAAPGGTAAAAAVPAALASASACVPAGVTAAGSAALRLDRLAAGGLRVGAASATSASAGTSWSSVHQYRSHNSSSNTIHALKEGTSCTVHRSCIPAESMHTWRQRWRGLQDARAAQLCRQLSQQPRISAGRHHRLGCGTHVRTRCSCCDHGGHAGGWHLRDRPLLPWRTPASLRRRSLGGHVAQHRSCCTGTAAALRLLRSCGCRLSRGGAAAVRGRQCSGGGALAPGRQAWQRQSAAHGLLAARGWTF